MQETVWTVRLFGAYRRFGATIELAAPEGAPAAALKAKLAAALRARHDDPAIDKLVASSALATESEVLLEDAPPPAGARLAILPPVSGG